MQVCIGRDDFKMMFFRDYWVRMLLKKVLQGACCSLLETRMMQMNEMPPQKIRQ
jgi:hypothetical protein